MKQILVFIGIAWCIFFLALGLSAIVYGQSNGPNPSSINWVHGSGLYVVETEVESLRQMYRDIGRKVFSWSEYTPKEIAEHQKTCLLEHGPGSFFVGDVKHANKTVDTYCAGAMPFPPMLAVQICFALKLEMAWMKPDEKRFACKTPGPPKEPEPPKELTRL